MLSHQGIIRGEGEAKIAFLVAEGDKETQRDRETKAVYLYAWMGVWFACEWGELKLNLSSSSLISIRKKEEELMQRGEKVQ